MKSLVRITKRITNHLEGDMRVALDKKKVNHAHLPV